MKIKLTTIFIASFIISACSGGGDGAPYVEPNDKPENIAAKKELEEFEWVKDLYASPGHMNIGVIHNEKDWSSSMIVHRTKFPLRVLAWLRHYMPKHSTPI